MFNIHFPAGFVRLHVSSNILNWQNSSERKKTAAHIAIPTTIENVNLHFLEIENALAYY